MNYKRSLISELEKTEEDVSPKEILEIIRIFYKVNKLGKMWSSKCGRLFMILGVICALASVILISTNLIYITRIGREGILTNWKDLLERDIFIYAFWIIVPPLWFLYEYVWLFPKLAKFDPDEVADLKYTQELGGKIWAGVVGLITILLYIKYGALIHTS